MAHWEVKGDPGKFHVNESDVEISTGHSKHGNFEPFIKPLSRRANGRQLTTNLVELNPGKIGWPFHWHTAIYVLSGEGTLRLGKERLPAKPGDYFALLPGGEDTAHQMINTHGTEPLRYLVMAILQPIEICGYPDSNKIMAAADGPDGKSMFRKMFDKATPDLDYYAGE